MENVILGILEIEKNAKARLAEAENEKNKIIADARKEREKIIRARVREAEKKLDQIGSEEKKEADKRLAEIEALKNDEIKRLNKTFEERRKQWEDDIFNAVING